LVKFEFSEFDKTYCNLHQRLTREDARHSGDLPRVQIIRVEQDASPISLKGRLLYQLLLFFLLVLMMLDVRRRVTAEGPWCKVVVSIKVHKLTVNASEEAATKEVEGVTLTRLVLNSLLVIL